MEKKILVLKTYILNKIKWMCFIEDEDSSGVVGESETHSLEITQ